MARKIHRAHAALPEHPFDGEPGEHLTDLVHHDPLSVPVAGQRDRPGICETYWHTPEIVRAR